MVKRPHLLVVEEDVRLRNECFAVVTDVAEIFLYIGQIPTVVEGLPPRGESAHMAGVSRLVPRNATLSVQWRARSSRSAPDRPPRP